MAVMNIEKTWSKVLKWTIFVYISGSAAATYAMNTTTKAVVKPETAAEPELGKRVSN